jgi:enoyl-CoA hydratase
VNRLVEPADLLPAVEALAARLARNGPLALRAIKRTALETSGLPLAEAHAIEAQRSAPVMRSEDAREGPRAFAEKRPPVYRGR